MSYNYEARLQIKPSSLRSHFEARGRFYLTNTFANLVTCSGVLINHVEFRPIAGSIPSANAQLQGAFSLINHDADTSLIKRNNRT